jgi:hypothetical protein
MDAAVGWLLLPPSDAALFALAIGTGAILTVVRLFTTNQDLLRRCARDKKRLRRLIRAAKREGDKGAVARYRRTRGMIAAKAAKYEGLPVLAALIPIALLGTWAFQRLRYQPPRMGAPIEVVVYFPITAAGQIVHLVPEDGLTSENGWVREIRPGESAQGVAAWTLAAQGPPAAHKLRIRYQGGTYTAPLRVGQRHYAPPVTLYDDGRVLSTEVKLNEVRLFGVIRGIRILALPPWLVAYLIIAIPSVSLLKRVLRIH